MGIVVSRELLSIFQAEADEIIGRMEQSLIALESRPDDAELLNTIFRGAHTLKGNAASLGFTALADSSHAVEDVLDRLREGREVMTPALTTLLLRIVDAFREMLADPQTQGVHLSSNHRKLLQTLVKHTPKRTRRDHAPIADAKSMTEDVTGDVTTKSAKNEAESDVLNFITADEDSKSNVRHDASRTLRVDRGTLDALMDLAGEIAIARERLDHACEVVGSAGAFVKETHREADNLYLMLQDTIISARMVPLGPTFRQHARTVRDSMTEHGKRARLVIEGDDVMVDATVIAHIREALIHLIRNAMDHGVESPDARVASGKDPCGTLTLRARRESGQIVIEVADDGSGFDRESIRNAARERGMLPKERELSNKEIDRLVFAPGFTTSDEVTKLSGRGVGLDVVRRNVEAVRGAIEVESRPREGTTIRIRLPLTLAIIDGFHVVAGGRTYVLPTETVVECRERPRRGLSPDGFGLTDRDGHSLPFMRLSRLLDMDAPEPAREDLIVVEQNDVQAGLVVDRILGAMPTVVKTLGPLFTELSRYSGATILGSGDVALILNVESVLRSAPRQAQEVAE